MSRPEHVRCENCCFAGQSRLEASWYCYFEPPSRRDGDRFPVTAPGNFCSHFSESWPMQEQDERFREINDALQGRQYWKPDLKRAGEILTKVWEDVPRETSGG